MLIERLWGQAPFLGIIYNHVYTFYNNFVNI